jgi:O-antigen ligase
MDREKLDAWCERSILWLVLAILITSPLFTGMVRPQDFVIVEWLTMLVLLVWLCRFWINPKHRLLWPPVCWLVVLFMGYAAVRYLTADIEFAARQEMIKVLIYGFLFLAILHNLHRLETTQIIAMCLICLATAISLYALLQFLTDSDRVWHFIRPATYHKRGSGTFIIPNSLAGYLEMLLPLALVFTLTARFGYLLKVWMGYAGLMIFTGILVTISRGGWIATGITLTVLFAWLLRYRDYRLQCLLVMTGLAAIATLFYFTARLSPNRLESIKSIDTNELRLRLWEPAIEIWKQNVWWGGGPAHYDFLFRQHRPAKVFAEQTQVRPDRVHNDYLNTLADWGLVGALLIVAAWGSFYWGVFRSWKFVQRAQNDFATKRSNKSSFVLGGALGLFAILLHSFVDFNMHIPANAILAVSLMALVTAYFRFATEKYWHTVHGPMRMTLTLFLAGGVVYLGIQSWRRTIETHWLVQAEELPYYSKEQLSVLQKAFAVEPKNFETAYLIGEGYRMTSWQGGEDYKELARTAMLWFKRSMELNPLDPYSVMRYGMCLHWIGQHAEADAYFKRAYELDPNGFYTLAHIGWHYVQLENWAVAKEWFEKSLNLYWRDNPIARSYLEIVNRKLAEAGTSKQ